MMIVIITAIVSTIITITFCFNYLDILYWHIGDFSYECYECFSRFLQLFYRLIAVVTLSVL
jgi:hypothetical protein